MARTNAKRCHPTLETLDDRIVPAKLVAGPSDGTANPAHADKVKGHGRDDAPGQLKTFHLAGGSLSGYVFQDDNWDGIRQAAELTFSGVGIQLTGVTDLGQKVDITVQTNASGFYQFTNLGAGTYSIVELDPPSVNSNGKTTLDGPTIAGNLGGVVQAPYSGDGVNPPILNGITNIVVGAGQSGVNYNFSEIEEVLE